jgi:hypothetical protein
VKPRKEEEEEEALLFINVLVLRSYTKWIGQVMMWFTINVKALNPSAVTQYSSCLAYKS